MTIELVNGDCLQYMVTLEDNSFDLAVVDPPYGLNMAKSFSQNGSNGCKNWGQYPHKDWDNNVPNQQYFDELMRVSKNQIIWGGNYFIDKIKISSQGWIVWNKGQRNFTLADGELAWTSFDKAMRIFDMARGQALFENRKTGGMFHPTKKPVGLYQWIFDKYAKKGMKILDTHLGSGSSAIAAHDSGLDFVGIELDADYFQAAKERLETHQQQLRLFT